MFIFSVNVYAKINITADDISGDDNLKQTLLSILLQDNVIDENAVFVATDGVNSSGYGTIDKPYATVDYAIQKVTPDTTIYVRGGVYDQKIVFRQSGTAENYLTVKAYPGEKPVFETSSYGRIIDPNKNNYIYIEGLTLKAKADKITNSTHGVEMTEGHHIIFRNMEIYNINVPDPTSSSVSSHAFNFYGSNASNPISNIIVENCYIHDMQTGWSEALTVSGNSEYVNVINCRISDIGNIGLDFAGNFGACNTAELDQARYCVARGNTVSGCISPNARSYGLYNDGGRDNIFDRNIVYGCTGGIEIGSEEGGKSGKQPVKNIQITNNLVYDNIEIGIAVGGYSITNSSVGYVYDVKIYNNTIVNNAESDIIVNKSDNLDYRNNIIYSKLPENSNYSYKSAIKISFDENYTTNLNFSNNIYYSPDGVNAFCFRNCDTKIFGIENWIDKTGKFVDPLFTDGYMLSENSPAISNADNSVIFIIGSKDLSDMPRIRGSLDNGCYEYQEGDIVTTESTTEKTTSETTTTTTESSTEITTSSIPDKPVQGGFYKHNFTENDKESNYFTISGNLSNSKGNTTFNNLDLTQCLKIESSTNIKFTANKSGILTLVFVGTTNIKIDGTKVTGTNGIITIELSEGSHTITKADVAYLFYMSFVETNLKGDINVDGIVDNKDAALALKDISNISVLETELKNIGDIDSDGNLDLTDVFKMLEV